MAYNSSNKNRYASSYDEVLSFLKKQGYEVRGGKALDEAAIRARSEETHVSGHRVYTWKATNDAGLALNDAIRKKATKLIDGIPDSTALPLLVWMSHLYSLESIKDKGCIDPEPGWLNFRYEFDETGAVESAPDDFHSREEIKRLLITCFEKSSSLFIRSLSVLSKAFKGALNNKSNYSSHLRLKNFISHHYPEPRSVQEYAKTQKLINTYKARYSVLDVPSQKGDLILTLLSAAYSYPRRNPDSFFIQWPALLKHDSDALQKIGNAKLVQAATEAFKKPFYSRADVVMEIDRLTEYEYKDLMIRDKYYRRIKYHLKKHLPKNKDEAVTKTFTVSKYFFQQTKLKPELKSTENVKLAIAEALENIDKIKEAIANSDIYITRHSKPPRIASRLTEPTSNQLDSLAKKLKGEGNLPTNANRSVALEIAVLFKSHADSTRRKDTYPSHTRPNDAFNKLVRAHEEEARPPASLAETTESLAANHILEKKLPIDLNSNADQQKELPEPPQEDSPASEAGAPAAHENEVRPRGDTGTLEEPDDQSSEPSANTEKHQPESNLEGSTAATATSTEAHEKPPLSGSSVKRKREPGQDLYGNGNWTQLAQQRDKSENKQMPIESDDNQPDFTIPDTNICSKLDDHDDPKIESIETNQQNTSQAEPDRAATTQEPTEDHQSLHPLTIRSPRGETNTIFVKARKRKTFTP